MFGKASETGIKTGFMREHTLEDQPEGWQTRGRSSSVGHRKVRQADSRARSFNQDDPFARPTEGKLRSTGVEKIADDYREKPKRMSPEEIQEYLYRSGNGVMQKDMALMKSYSFLEDYSVMSPITKEQKQKRRQEQQRISKDN